MTESAAHVRVIEETSAYWRVVFDYPPFNIVDATIFEGLQDLLARMDASPNLRVVVFESARERARHPRRRESELGRHVCVD
jgi:enoyl-CoA hydratase/carnithine racemase